MINLEQIQKLEARVTKAVDLIKTLRAENQSLRRTLDSTQTRMRDLEKLVDDFKSDQKDIEECILRALENLNELEDEITDRQAEPPPTQKDAGGEQENLPEESPETQEEAEEKSASDGSGELDIF